MRQHSREWRAVGRRTHGHMFFSSHHTCPPWYTLVYTGRKGKEERVPLGARARARAHAAASRPPGSAMGLKELLGGGSGGGGERDLYDGVEYWNGPYDRTGWLQKQGEFLPNWRRRWFVLKEGKIFWFKSSSLSAASKPRGVIDVRRCLSIKVGGATDADTAFPLPLPPELVLSLLRVAPPYALVDPEGRANAWRSGR